MSALFVNPQPEGYGSHFVVLSTALERVALNSSCQLRLSTLFSSYGWLSVITKNGCPDTYRFDPYCRTALEVQRDIVKHCNDVLAQWSPPAVYTALLLVFWLHS